jgi:hypothetical protein
MNPWSKQSSLCGIHNDDKKMKEIEKIVNLFDNTRCVFFTTLHR